MKNKTQADYRRGTFYQNWFIKKIMPILAIIILVLVFVLGFVWAGDSHWAFKTLPKGEIILLEDRETIYVPKGAYIIGETHLYGANDDVVFDDIILENKPTDSEQLVRTSGEVVVYWSLDQKAAAENLLLDN